MKLLRILLPVNDCKSVTRIKLNPFTLAFRTELEKDFREKYFESSLKFVRLSFIAGVIFFLLFSFLDHKLTQSHLSVLTTIRTCVVAPVILLVFVLSFLPNFKKYWQFAIMFSVIVSGAGIILMLIGAPRVIERGYYVGLILVLIYGYFLIKLRYINASICGFLLVVMYQLISHFFLDLPADKAFANSFFLISCNLALMLGSYLMELTVRGDFYSRYLLNLEKENVRRVNQELEKLVDKRTNEIKDINVQLMNKIKELHKSQEDIIASEEQIRLAYDTSNATIWGIDLDKKNYLFNEAYIKMLGYPVESVDEINWLGLIHPDDEKLLETALEDICRQKTDKIDIEFRLKSYLGDWVWLHAWGGVSEKGNSGAAQSIVGTMIDITERKQTEIELQKYRLNLEKSVHERTKNLESSQKALVCLMEDMNLAREELANVNQQLQNVNEELQSFSYSVSHDLRSPLRAIDGITRILLEDYEDKLDETGREHLDLIVENTGKMNQLITDLLEFSRMGRKMINPEDIDFKELMKKAFDSQIINHPQRDIQITIGDFPPISADFNLMMQVAQNLISNAIKFTKNKETALIEVGYLQDNDQDVIFVKDNGVGFDMNYADKLFGVFQRLHTQEEFQGYGVGLSLVKRIITKHSGRIWAESKKNQGAAFYFALPHKKS